ncbi:MAG: TRAP transporter permease DctQ [Gammaproteobacteria bacterium]|nr:TRAP transporter permease DctQ [Gammaproteobacteria bacterium]|tara:strand:+ start:64 stop:537 length:474 start_codon:yes stop_codon:yes gene_type:complete
MLNMEKTINFLGKFISLMIPTMTILMMVIIVARYFFGIGLTGIQELVMYIHALVFLGCAGYVQFKDEHVRVDIFYRESSSNYKKKVNLFLGLLFLLPLCFVIGYFSIELINMAWRIREVSTEAGGLSFVYIQKTLIILFPITLLLTLVYQFIKNKWN